MTYDPRLLGAKCDSCPLNGDKPVPPSPAKGRPFLVILGESPGQNETREGKPFIGASGYLLNYALKKAGAKRDDCHVTNTVLCRPPTRFKPKDWQKAIECCRPRFDNELGKISSKISILALGEWAMWGTTGHRKVGNWFGYPLKSKYGPVMPSFQPAAALRQPALYPIFYEMVRRGVEMGRGRLASWKWPTLTIEGDYREPLQALLTSGEPIAVDIENTGDPLHSDMLCIGFANRNLAVSLPWSAMEGEIKELVSSILSSHEIPKIFHNGQHDVTALKSHNLAVNGTLHDTILAHAVLAPGLSHRLSDVAAYEFVAPRWKTIFGEGKEEKGVEKFTKANPLDLRLYNAKDAYMTAKLWQVLEQRLKAA